MEKELMRVLLFTFLMHKQWHKPIPMDEEGDLVL